MDYLRTAVALANAEEAKGGWGYTTPTLHNMLDEELLDLARDDDNPLVRELASRLDRANYYIETEMEDWDYDRD